MKNSSLLCRLFFISSALASSMHTFIFLIVNKYYNLSINDILFLRSIVFFFILSICLVIFYKKINLFKIISLKNYVTDLPRNLSSYASVYIYFYCLKKISVNDMTIVSFLLPLLVVLLSSIIFKEKINLKFYISFVIGFAGVIISLGNFKSSYSFNTALILMIFLFSRALFNILLKFFSHKISIYETIIYGFFTQLIFSFFSFFRSFEENHTLFKIMNIKLIVLLLFISFIFINIVFLLYISLKFEKMQNLQNLDFIRLPVNAGLSFLLFGDKVSLNFIIGSIFILFALYYNNKSRVL